MVLDDILPDDYGKRLTFTLPESGGDVNFRSGNHFPRILSIIPYSRASEEVIQKSLSISAKTLS